MVMPRGPRKKPTHVQILCNSCGLKLTERIHTWNTNSHGHGKRYIRCLSPVCGGLMFEHGQKLSGRNTIAKKRSVDFQRKLNARSVRSGRGVRKADPMFISSPTNDDDSDDSFEQDDSDDLDFIALVDFSPRMRLTTGRTGQVRDFLGGHAGTAKSTGLVAIANPILGEREKSTNACFGNVAAWQHAQNHGAPNAGNYSKVARNHYEWCHLQAVSLGGKTRQTNLAAGHFALNTWMMTVEGIIQGKSGLKIEVTAYCVNPHVIDSLRYDIYSGNTLKIRLVADGRMSLFSQIDYDALVDKLKRVGIRR